MSSAQCVVIECSWGETQPIERCVLNTKGRVVGPFTSEIRDYDYRIPADAWEVMFCADASL